MTGNEAEVRILVVLAAPDERGSTLVLRSIVDELGRRSDAQVATWFLRDLQDQRWAETRDVDSLRRNPIDRLLTAGGLGVVAGAIRGRRLRRWFAEAAPDAVILDDGYGARLLEYAPGRPLVVVRSNPLDGQTWGLDEPRITAGDLTISHLDPPEGGHDPSRWLRFLWVEEPPIETVLQGGGGPPAGDLAVVNGWGTQGWLDGSDIFVRTIWFLRRLGHRDVKATWFLPAEDEDERRRLEREIRLCGLEETVTLGELHDGSPLWEADAVVIASRDQADPHRIAEAGRHQVPVALFGPASLRVPWVTEAPMLDLPALARALAQALEGTHPLPPAQWPAMVDPARFAEVLVASIRDTVR